VEKAIGFIVILALLGAGTAGAGEARAVDAVGLARVAGGNVSAARDLAKNDAFDEAVAQVIRALVPPDRLSGSFSLAGKVLDQREAYIQEFQVLAEAESGGAVRLLVRVTVDVDGVSRALTQAGLLSDKAGLPLCVVLLEEKNVNDPASRSWWSPALTSVPQAGAQEVVARELSAAGFRVADSTEAVRALVASPGFTPGPMGDDVALSLAREAGAQVLFLGSAVAGPAENAMGATMKSFQGTVSLRALSVETGQALASEEATARAVSGVDEEGGRQAMDLAAAEAAKKLSAGVAGALQSQNEPAKIEMTIKGVQNLSRFVAFRRELQENTQGVSQVSQRSMDGTQAVMEIEYQGAAQDLAQALLLKTYDGFGVSIGEVAEARMDLELVDKP